MEGCLQRGGPVDAQGHPLPLGAAGGAGAPTSAYMEGTIAVGIVMVEGPTAALQFSAAERQHVVAEVQNGLGWYAAQNPAANITFVYDIQTVRVNVQPNPNAPDLEGLWRDPAMAALGYAANWSGVTSYVEHLRTSLATQWTYCAYFTKYPLSWFAYVSIGGPRLVMAYDNDGWGPDNIDRVFAHETGHIFGCPDEYAASGCTCGGSWGRFGTPNSNCQNCAPGGGVSCIMKQNDYTYCSATPSHLGWSMGTTTGNPVLIQSRFGTQGNYELAVPSAFTGIDARVRNNDLPGMPWSAINQFAQTLGRVDSLSMIQSSFGTPGNLELVARVGDTLHAFWRDSGPTFTWNGPAQVATGAAGNPVLIQSRFGQTGNFELAYPLAAGGIGIKWRNNDAPAMPWSATTSFAQSLGRVDALTMIQSSFGTPGNLELVARVGDTLHAFWRDSGPTFTWNGRCAGRHRCRRQPGADPVPVRPDRQLRARLPPGRRRHRHQVARQRRPRHALVRHHLFRPNTRPRRQPEHDPVQLRDPREPRSGRPRRQRPPRLLARLRPHLQLERPVPDPLTGRHATPGPPDRVARNLARPRPGRRPAGAWSCDVSRAMR